MESENEVVVLNEDLSKLDVFSARLNDNVSMLRMRCAPLKCRVQSSERIGFMRKLGHAENEVIEGDKSNYSGVSH